MPSATSTPVRWHTVRQLLRAARGANHLRSGVREEQHRMRFLLEVENRGRQLHSHWLELHIGPDASTTWAQLPGGRITEAEAGSLTELVARAVAAASQRPHIETREDRATYK